MKKLIVLGIIVLAFAMVLSVSAIAANPKATLINSSGDKVVVAAGSKEAQSYFAKGYVLMGAPLDVCKNCVGVAAGPDHYQRQYFHSGFNAGGDVFATTSPVRLAAYTLLPSEIDQDVYLIEWLPNLDITITLPATTTAGFDNIIGTVPGSSREYILRNASSTVGGIITLAAGTGIDLQKNEDTADLATAGTSMTLLRFIRLVSSDVMVTMEQFDVAD